MNFENKTLLHYAEVEDKNISETAKEFYNYMLWAKAKQYNFSERMPLEGCASEIKIYDRSNDEFRKMLNFGSNDYLNLCKHYKTIQASTNAIRKYGTGTGSAPL